MDEAALASWLQRSYPLSRVSEIRLLRAYTNTVYRVACAADPYVLKVYGAGWRCESEIHYEVDLLNYLANRGLPVAKPVRGIDDQIVRRTSPDLGERWAVLFEYAAGEKPEPPFSDQLYIQFGAAVGKLHELSNEFSTDHYRHPIDIGFLIDQPLALVLPLLAEQPQEANYLLNLGRKINNRMRTLDQLGLDWGPIHGDATLDNLHWVNRQHVVLYDFDSGGPGWRASDLQGWAAAYPEHQSHYAAFIQGYQQIRPVKAQDIEASWYMTLAWDIWGLKVDLENRVSKQGRAATNRYLSAQIEQIRTREKRLHLPG